MSGCSTDGGYVHCDETTVQVLEEPGKSVQSKSYMWVQVSGTGEEPVVLFDYDPSRSAQVPKRLLDGFSGYLQTDAYSGYNEVVRDNDITRVLCLAHARRHFVDGLKAQGINPDKLPAKPPDKARRLLTALSYLRTIYTIERRIRGRPPDERYAVRQREIRPVLDRLHQWAKTARPKVAPKAPLGKALAYLLEHWEGLIRFLDDGRLEVDNNRARRMPSAPLRSDAAPGCSVRPSKEPKPAPASIRLSKLRRQMDSSPTPTFVTSSLSSPRRRPSKPSRHFCPGTSTAIPSRCNYPRPPRGSWSAY